MSEVDQYRRLVELAQKISAIEDKVDFMLRELKLDYRPPVPPEPDEVQKLLKAGRKLEAIKLYRESHDIGLAEAKAAVEQIELGFFKQ